MKRASLYSRLQRSSLSILRRRKNKKVGAVSKLRSSSSSIMDDAGPSLFVVVSWEYSDHNLFSSIVQLETQVNNHEYASSPKTQPIPTEFSAHFHRPQPQLHLPIMWAFSPLASSTEASFTEDLYMVPDENELHGCVFNLRTKKCKRIKGPRATKYIGHVVTLGGHIYFMAHPHAGNLAPHPVFERYDPRKDSWEEREPFPYHTLNLSYANGGKIEATAVWDDTILLNMVGRKIWAYNVDKNKWYPVDVNHGRCYSIVGEAVVLENTIYALTEASFEKILALSIEREEINGDLVYKCSLLSEILVPGMEQITFESEDEYRLTRHLVHLGKGNFCLVLSCTLSGAMNECQHIQVTNIKLEGKNSMTVTNICVHEFKIQQNRQFEVSLCFSLPECKTTASEEGKRFFEFDPLPKRFASKASTISAVTGHPSHGYAKPSFAPKASTLGDGAASERSNTDEEGHSILVRNLPRKGTVRHLENGLKEFGPIKRDGIKVRKNKTGKSFAFVEFESATSKRRAIEASPITIGGCLAEIEDKEKNRPPSR